MRIRKTPQKTGTANISLSIMDAVGQEGEEATQEEHTNIRARVHSKVQS